MAADMLFSTLAIFPNVRRAAADIQSIERKIKWALPSQVIIGPGSNPSSQAHSKPPITLVQVPFPHGLPMEHSSVSAKDTRKEGSKFVYLKEKLQVRIEQPPS